MWLTKKPFHTSQQRYRWVFFAVVVLLSGCMFLLTHEIPLLKMMGEVLSPLPIALYGVQYSWPQGILAAVATGLFLLPGGWQKAIYFIFTLGLWGVLLAFGNSKTLSFNRILLLAAVVGLLTFFLPVLMDTLGNAKNIREVIQGQKEAYHKAIEQVLASFKEKPEGLEKALLWSMPAQVFLNIFLPLLLSLALFWHTLKKSGFSLPWTFSEWRLPESLVWLLILFSSGVLFSHQVSSMAMQVWFLNLLLTMLALYLLQGLAIVRFFFLRWSVHPILQGMFFFLLFVQPLVVVPITLGVFDFWMDARGKWLQRKSEV